MSNADRFVQVDAQLRHARQNVCLLNAYAAPTCPQTYMRIAENRLTV